MKYNKLYKLKCWQDSFVPSDVDSARLASSELAFAPESGLDDEFLLRETLLDAVVLEAR